MVAGRHKRRRPRRLPQLSRGPSPTRRRGTAGARPWPTRRASRRGPPGRGRGGGARRGVRRGPPPGRGPPAARAPPAAQAQPASAPQPASRPSATPAPVRAGERDEVIPFSRIRKVTAEHMIRSKATSAHTLVVIECDYEGVDKVRRAQRERFRAEEGISLTYLPFQSRAVIDAIREFPMMNSSVGDDEL